MNKMQAQVAKFHAATGVPRPPTPQLVENRLRLDLILEELIELGEALGFVLAEERDSYNVAWLNADDYAEFRGDPPEPFPVTIQPIKALDAIGDLLYVIFGTAEQWGIDIEPYFDEIHRSNMTKVGGEIREDGKRLKPKWYEPPRLEPIFRRQQADAERALLEEPA